MTRTENESRELIKAKLLGFEVVTLGHPALRSPSQRISIETLQSGTFRQFTENLRHTLDRTGGVGLAAPQVGVNIELFITQIPEQCAKRYLLCQESPFSVWINPTYEIMDPEDMTCIEGCLSVPGYVGRVVRPKAIKVRALDANGEEFVQELIGWNARVFLHEYDHLKGTVYVDKLKSDNGACRDLYEGNMWKTIEAEKRGNKDYNWLEQHGLMPDK